MEKRDNTTKLKTEFYMFYRTIKFEQSQAILREHIVMNLNELLTKLRIGAKIEIGGIPTSEDFLKMREEFLNGNIKFEDVPNKTHF